MNELQRLRMIVGLLYDGLTKEAREEAAAYFEGHTLPACDGRVDGPKDGPCPKCGGIAPDPKTETTL